MSENNIQMTNGIEETLPPHFVDGHELADSDNDCQECDKSVTASVQDTSMYDWIFYIETHWGDQMGLYSQRKIIHAVQLGALTKSEAYGVLDQACENMIERWGRLHVGTVENEEDCDFVGYHLTSQVPASHPKISALADATGELSCVEVNLSEYYCLCRSGTCSYEYLFALTTLENARFLENFDSHLNTLKQNNFFTYSDLDVLTKARHIADCCRTAQSNQSSDAGEIVLAQSPKKRGRPPGSSYTNLNARLTEHFQKHGGDMERTSSDLAKLLGVDESAIRKTSIWKQISKSSKQNKNERPREAELDFSDKESMGIIKQD